MDLSFSEFTKGEKWFILPAAFEEMFARLHKEGKDQTLAAALQIGQQQQQSDFYQIDNSVAIIPVTGPLTKRASFMSFLFGGTSYAFIRRAIREANEDSRIDAIVLRIDSPGGVVNGVEETGDVIFNLRGQKPIIAYNDGQMMSAAYWLGSAADVIVSNKTAGAGSIGVLMVHADWSRYDEAAGIKYTYLTAGKYKALGNPDEPLSDLAKETFQAELDYLYSIFVNTVARNRDVEEQKVLSDMADGRVFLGQQSVDAGLVDQISDLQSAVDFARQMAGSRTNNSRRVNAMKIETIEQLRAEYPDLVKQVEDRARGSVDLESVKKEVAAGERNRVLDLAAVQFGEKGEKFKAVVETGVSVEQFKAIQQAAGAPAEDKDTISAKTEADRIAAEKAAMLEATKKAGAQNPGFDANAGGGQMGYMEAVEKYQTDHKCSKFEAMQAVNKKNPELRQKFLKAVNS